MIGTYPINILIMLFLIFLSIIVFVAIVVISFEVYKKYDHGWKIYMTYPGPCSKIFFGNVFDVPASTEDMFVADLVRAEKWPKMYKFPMLHIKVIMCYDADDMEYFLSGHTTTQKSFVYDYMKPWMGTGLLTSEGDKWFTRRKMLTPCFHFNILQGFLQVFHSETKHLVKILLRECNAEYLNVVPLISEFTLDSINDTAMGINPTEVGDGRTYKNALLRLGQIITQRLMRPWFYNKYSYMISPSYWEEKKLLAALHNYTDKVIKLRERRFTGFNMEEDLDQDDNWSYATRKRMAMLDLLISEKQKGNIDYEGIREEVDTFMFEGHDTVSMAICYALLLLANYKTVQHLVRDEIYEVLGDEENPTIEQLNQLKYMERCIKEILRLYPSVPWLFRETIKEGTSPSGRVYPKGIVILSEIYNLHRDPDIFPDPEKFDPDRFLTENSRDRHPYGYIPFSAGPRNCIGQKFAFLEIKAVLCGILREFNLEPVHRREDIVIKVDIVLRPNDDGIRVKFVPRK